MIKEKYNQWCNPIKLAVIKTKHVINLSMRNKMEKIKAKMFFSVLIFILTSCSTNTIKEPEQIGKQVFEILKNMSIKSKIDFVANFVSIEEIRELGKNEDAVLEEEMRNELTSMLKNDWVIIIENNYNDIKEKNEEYDINWQEIEYLDFVYKTEIKDGVKVFMGSLYFKYNNKQFTIKSSSIFNGTEYRLVRIYDLNVQK